MTPHLLHVLVVDEIRRQHAGGIAGVDTGVFNVLHDAADDALFSIAQGIHIGFERIFQEAVDQHRVVGRDAHCIAEVIPQRRLVIYDLHGPSSEHIRRTNQNGIAHAFSHDHRVIHLGHGAAGRLCYAQASRQLLKAPPILCDIDRIRTGSQYRDAGFLQLLGELEWSLAAELDDDSFGLLEPYDFEHVLERERLEVQLV